MLAPIALSAAFLSPPPVTRLPLELDEPAGVGEIVPDHEFAPLVNHDGRTRLSELVGQPVLLVGWRANFNDGVQGLAQAFELVKKHGLEDLVLILENRNVWRTDDQWVGELGFLYVQLPSLRRAWVSNNPDQAGAPDIPIRRARGRTLQSIALVGVDGTLLVEGEAEEVAEDLAKRVAAEVKRRRKGWGEDKVAIQARALAFGKDQLSKALAALDKAAETQVPEHQTVRAELQRHFQARLKSLRFYVDEARYLDADEALRALQKSVKGQASWLEALAPIQVELDSDGVARERALDKKLRKILKGLQDDAKMEPKTLEKLREFVADNGGTRVGARAARLEPLIVDMVRMVYGADAVR